MSKIRQNRVIDQTVGKTQQAGVKPLTGGAVHNAAAAKRAANAGSSRRALKSAVGDWMKAAFAASNALDAGLETLKTARDAGNEDLVSLLEQACQQLLDRFDEIVSRGPDLKEQVQAENVDAVSAGQPDAEGVVETNTGELPRASGSADAMDAGARAVLDHMANVSIEHVRHMIDAATMLQLETAEWKKHVLIRALADGDEAEAHRIRAGYPYYPDCAPGVVADYIKKVRN
jgi:hypothetical protein